MLKSKPRSLDAPVEPIPRYPSDADIAAAERLRQRLEEQYLTPSTASSLEPRREQREPVKDV